MSPFCFFADFFFKRKTRKIEGPQKRGVLQIVHEKKFDTNPSTLTRVCCCINRWLRRFPLSPTYGMTVHAIETEEKLIEQLQDKDSNCDNTDDSEKQTLKQNTVL